MKRRGAQTEQEFGSDSFLDIVANIVGILIILMVLAGIRVKDLPVDLPSEPPQIAESQPNVESLSPAYGEKTDAEKPPQLVEAETVETATPKLAIDPELKPPVEESKPQPAQPVKLATAPEPASPEPRKKAEESRVEAAEQHQVQLAQLQQEVASLDERAKQQQQASTQRQQMLQTAVEKLQQRNTELQRLVQQIAAKQEELVEADNNRQREQGLLLSLDFELQKLKQNEPRPPTVEHRLTPVAETVEGKEYYFRLAGNRVSIVPMDDLLGELRDELQRHRSWLLKYNRQQGRVGPIRGYSLAYLAERQSVSPVEQLDAQQGLVRVAVTYWRIEPGDGIFNETLEEALKPGSRFYLTVQSIEPNATLTFWVSPDSYTLFRGLQDFAHQRGLRVAARPLPDGAPIAGSPQGSRSVGQ